MKKFEIYLNTLASTKPEEVVKVNERVVDINLNSKNIEIEDKENNTKVSQVQYDCYRVRDLNISVNDIINELIRSKYSESEELSILRQRDTKADEFETYNSYCEDCKTLGKEIYEDIHK